MEYILICYIEQHSYILYLCGVRLSVVTYFIIIAK